MLAWGSHHFVSLLYLQYAVAAYLKKPGGRRMMSCKGRVRVPGSPDPQQARPAPLEEKACKTHLLASQVSWENKQGNHGKGRH